VASSGSVQIIRKLRFEVASGLVGYVAHGQLLELQRLTKMVELAGAEPEGSGISIPVNKRGEELTSGDLTHALTNFMDED